MGHYLTRLIGIEEPTIKMTAIPSTISSAPKELSQSRSSSTESEVEITADKSRTESPVLNRRFKSSNSNIYKNHQTNSVGGDSLCHPSSSSDVPLFSSMRKRKAPSKFSSYHSNFQL